MKTFPSSLTTAFTDVTKAPRYLARFTHVACRKEYPFSADFTTGPVATPPTSYFEILDFPTGNTQTVEPEQGRSSIGTFRFPMLDHEGIVTKYFSDPGATVSQTLSRALDYVPASVTGGDLRNCFPPRGTVEVTATPVAYLTAAMSDGYVAAGHLVGDLADTTITYKVFYLATNLASDTAGNYIPWLETTGRPAGIPLDGYIYVNSEMLQYHNYYDDDPPEKFGAPYGHSTAYGWVRRGTPLGTTDVHSIGDEVRWSVAPSHYVITVSVAGQTDLRSAFPGSGYIKIGNENIYYTTITASTLGDPTHPVTRGWGGLPESHVASAVVYKIGTIVIEAAMYGLPGVLTDHFASSGRLQIDGEVIWYTTLTASTFGTPENPCIRGFGGTTPGSHRGAIIMVQTLAAAVASNVAHTDTNIFAWGALNVGSAAGLEYFASGIPVRIGNEWVMPNTTTFATFGSSNGAAGPCSRGINGTTATSHVLGTMVYQTLTKQLDMTTVSAGAATLQYSGGLWEESTTASCFPCNSGTIRIVNEVLTYTFIDRTEEFIGKPTEILSIW